MKYVLGFILPAIIISQSASAFDEEMYAVSPVPRGDTQEVLVGLSHAFATKVIENSELAKDLVQKKFGFRSANVGISASWLPINNVAVRFATRSSGPGFSLGGSAYYSSSFISADAGLNLQANYVQNELKKSFLPFISLSSPYLAKFKFEPTLNLAYDSYNLQWGAGVGLAYDATEKSRITCEYFPRLTRDVHNAAIGKKDAFNYGYRYTSGGHHFFILIANTAAVDLGQAILGVENNDLNFAFRVTREM